MSENQPSSGGLIFKLGLVVVSVGVCALAMLAMRQARLQAAHELTQTQLRIQRADERLWKMRAEIAGLSNPSRIRELAGNLGPMHALINPVETSASPSWNTAIPMVEKIQPPKAQGKGEHKPDPKTDAKSTKTPSKTTDSKSTPAKPGDKNGKPESKNSPQLANPRTISPTGLALAPAPKVPTQLDR
ncbi:MAG: hypothetical protein JSS51_02990 [Planctomycetes bacterium]|nr:hypothetical protein [Planctomycetota bacterium]